MEKKTNNPIDRILKEKLEGLNAPFDADSWQLMEQKLDEEVVGLEGEGQPAADTKHIDEAFFEKLHRYSVPYQPSHWQRMEALLEEVFTWPRQVLRYKLTELALMLLLLLLLWQDAPIGQGPDHQLPVPPVLESTPPDTPAGEATAPSARRQAETAPQASNFDGRNSALQKGAASSLAPSDGGNGITHATDGSAVDGPLAGKGALAGPDENEKGASRFLILPAPIGQRAAFLDIPYHQLPKKTAFPNNLLLAELDLLEGLIAELEYEGLRDIGDATITMNKNRTAFRVGMFGSAEYNYITVPSSEEKKLEEELQRYAMGYGGGLSLGFEMGRFEIETGAIYAARQYPVGLVYVNGSVGSGFQGQRLEASELNIINVPLHFRYSFLRRGGWRAYALAGASLQVAFQRNYYVTEEPQYNFLPMQPPPLAPSPGEEPTIDRIRRSGLGWFEGGTFEENAYLTGNLGLGLERYINSRWSLFVQPTYQHSLQYFRVGLGPNADQINSLSILFGAKVRVK